MSRPAPRIPRVPVPLTVLSAAAAAGVTPKTIRRWIAAGLPHKKIPAPGFTYAIDRRALDQWQAQERPGAPGGSAPA